MIYALSMSLGNGWSARMELNAYMNLGAKIKANAAVAVWARSLWGLSNLIATRYFSVEMGAFIDLCASSDINGRPEEDKYSRINCCFSTH